MKAFKIAFDFADTTASGNTKLPAVLQEEITEVYFNKSPKKTKTIMLANMATGLENLSATRIASEYIERIDMYDNMIEAGGKPFSSPFSPSSILTYRYFLSDSTVNEEGVKLYRLDFSPRNKHNIAFNGYAWIEKSNYAITEMEFRIPSKANLNFINEFYVYQAFNKPDGKHWFLYKEEMHVAANLLKTKKNRSILLEKRIERKDVELNIAIPDSIFKGEALIITDSVSNRSEDWWKKNRISELTQTEENIFYVVDSIQKTKTYVNLKNLLYTAITGYIRFGRKPPIEIGQFYKFVSWNNVEGVRLRFGAQTTKYFNRKALFTTYGAYGLKDKEWKYLANARFILPRKNQKWHSLEITVVKDFTFLGADNSDQLLNHDNFFLSLLRTKPLEKIMKIEEYKIHHVKEWVKGFSTDIYAARRRYFPVKGTFDFNKTTSEGIKEVSDITTTEFGVTAFLEFGTNYFESVFFRSRSGSKMPEVAISYSIGVEDLLGGDHSYHKFGFNLYHRWTHKLGFTKYRIRGGYTLGETPYPLMFIHQGYGGLYYNRNAYATMGEYEYASDRFASIWIDHHFDGKILNNIPLIKHLRLRSLLTFKFLIGDIKQSNRELIDMPATLTSTFNSKEKVYAEIGFGIENILKLLRVDFYFRLTQRDKNTFKGLAPNFAFKFAFQPKF